LTILSLPAQTDESHSRQFVETVRNVNWMVIATPTRDSISPFCLVGGPTVFRQVKQLMTDRF
jgi:hypothetical protein